MLSYKNSTVKTSVRKMVEFLLRSGDICTGTAIRADVEAMSEGSRLHKKIQKSKGKSYKSEVPLKMSWQERHPRTGKEYELVLEGRADGIDMVRMDQLSLTDQYPNADDAEKNDQGIQLCLDDRGKIIRDHNAPSSDKEKKATDRSVPLIDEIKCVYRDVTEIEEAEPLHLAQAMCYACLYGMEDSFNDHSVKDAKEESGEAFQESSDKTVRDESVREKDGSDRELTEIAVRITYCNIETEEIKYLDHIFSLKELEPWFMEIIDRYRVWAEYIVEAKDTLRESIHKLHFPFEYRPGQKQMSAVVYRAIHGRDHLFLQAPTGIGKTISAIYPAVKEMGNDNCDRIFYLTAKTITRTVAEKTFSILDQHELKLHSITITAKDRICILDTPTCEPDSCPRAQGHYDQINEAIYDLLTHERQISRETVLSYAKKHKVCPYELAFEAAFFCDCIICDYNYLFDPHTSIRGMAREIDRKGTVLLIDEAHNFPDRAREMYSADLKREELNFLRRHFRKKNPFMVNKIRTVIRKLTSPDDMEFPLMRLLEPLGEYLRDHPNIEDREELLQIFFRIQHFYMILLQKNEGYEVYSTGEKRSYVQHLFCVDPSSCIKEYLEKVRSAIFFSATLLPVGYYKQLLGGDTQVDAFSIPSPFDKSKRLLMVTNDVTSRYRQRGEHQYRRIISYLDIVNRAKKGNYMVFFPSYEMMSACVDIAITSLNTEECQLIVQAPSMDEDEKENFLKEFSVVRDKSLIGFCVLGSLFSEGIDLTGDQLIGVLIVGTGLPKICEEREIIRKYFDNKGKKGYDYAYRYPGMNRVLQAAGRVIRTRQDRGLILLMDDRFLLYENQTLLPQDWDSYYEVSLSNCSEVIKSFYEGQIGSNGE